jgi:hypothetical protein
MVRRFAPDSFKMHRGLLHREAIMMATVNAHRGWCLAGTISL